MAITFQRQGTHECLLAVFAMLADKPLDEVRARAFQLCAKRGKAIEHWWEVAYKGPDLFWDVVNELSMELFGRQIAQDGSFILAGPPLPPVIPKEGQGQITLKCKHGFHGHAVAYGDGKVYDPDNGTPDGMNEEEFQGYLVSYDFTVVRVTPLEKK